jgi:hypothetical protein
MAVAFERFLDLNAAARLRLLAALAFEGTLDGRGAYAPLSDGIENGPAIRQVNEFVHRMVSLMQHFLEGRENALAYAESLWADLIQPWGEARHGRLEALIQKSATANDPAS